MSFHVCAISMNLRVLSVIRGFFLINRRVRRDRKGFRHSFHACAISMNLCVLSALRGSILLTAESAKDSVTVFNTKPLLMGLQLFYFFFAKAGHLFYKSSFTARLLHQPCTFKFRLTGAFSKTTF